MSGLRSGSLRLGDREIALEDGETVLEGLERAGVDVASGCRAGTCCKCMLRADAPPVESQRTLRPTLRAQGHFLACQARPMGVLQLHSAAAPEPVGATVVALEHVAEDVARILLRPATPLDFRPGQYIDVLHPDGAARSYSVASLPSDEALELHVRRVPGGLVSPWLHGLGPGADLRIRGAFGQCFHVADDPHKKLLLVGAGTGLAPLLGIARDALLQGHRGPIDLIHGGIEPGRLYLRERLAELAREAPHLRVHHCVMRGATGTELEGALDEVAVRIGSPLDGARAFLCGDDQIVQLLRRRLFLAGLPSSEIFADPFTPASGSTPGTGTVHSSG